MTTDCAHSSPAASSPPGPTPRSSGLWKWVVLVVVLGVASVGYLRWGGELTLTNLASHEAALREYSRAHPVLVYGVAFATYVLVTGLSLPGATGMTLLFGWLFGFLRGVILVSFASTAGATLAFLLSRYLLRGIIQRRYQDRWAAMNAALEKEGAFYLFTLRLIPVIPFFVINLAMGLTSIRVWTFWWVSQVGMLAGTMVYVYAGSTVPDLQTLAEQGAAGILSLKMMVAFVLLGLFPITVKKVLGRWQRHGRGPG